MDFRYIITAYPNKLECECSQSKLKSMMLAELLINNNSVKKVTIHCVDISTMEQNSKLIKTYIK